MAATQAGPMETIMRNKVATDKLDEMTVPDNDTVVSSADTQHARDLQRFAQARSSCRHARQHVKRDTFSVR